MITPLCLKVTCLGLVVVKQVLVVTRFGILYAKVSGGNVHLHALLYYFYIPCIVTGTIFELFLILYLRREIRKDLLWWNAMFCRVFTLYSLMFWLYLYWQTLVQAYVYVAVTEYYAGSMAVDLLEHLANTGIGVLMIFILYRPVFFKATNTSEDTRAQVVFSTRDENVRVQNLFNNAANSTQLDSQQTNSLRKCALYMAVVFFLLYMIAIALLIVSMSS